jgi:hypothetical protein
VAGSEVKGSEVVESQVVGSKGVRYEAAMSENWRDF